MARCFQCMKEIMAGEEHKVDASGEILYLCPHCAPPGAKGPRVTFTATSAEAPIYLQPIPLSISGVKGSTTQPKSGTPNRVRAVVYGLLAALGYGLFWFLLMGILHIRSSVFALPLGYLVARAVVKGSGGYHGPLYQLVSIMLILAIIIAVESCGFALLPYDYIGGNAAILCWVATLFGGYYFTGGLKSRLPE